MSAPARLLGARREGLSSERAGVKAARPGQPALMDLQRQVGNRSVRGLLGDGSALSPDLQRALEGRFGASFSEVRVHEGPAAGDNAAALQAKAFTHGNDVVFGHGRFTPSTATGMALLGHELAHVIQQRRGGVAQSGEEDTSTERAADAAGRELVNGTGPIHVEGASGVGIACAPETDLDPSATEVPAQPTSVVENKPLSEAAESTEAFELNLAQRGHDYVQELRTANLKDENALKAIDEQLATPLDATKRDELRQFREKVHARLLVRRAKLQALSVPTLKDLGDLRQTLSKLQTSLGKKLKAQQRQSIERQVQSLQLQIEAVERLTANSGQGVGTGDLLAFRGGPLGIASRDTYVTVQVTTTDGKVRLFQAKNVPGADHAEDVAIASIKASDLGKSGAMKGARVVVFGDQEVCERCAKRLPAWAIEFGWQEIVGVSTHASTLTQGGSIAAPGALRAKSTSVKVSDPADVAKRETAQNVDSAGRPGVRTVQRVTFHWESPNGAARVPPAATPVLEAQASTQPRTIPGPPLKPGRVPSSAEPMQPTPRPRATASIDKNAHLENTDVRMRRLEGRLASVARVVGAAMHIGGEILNASDAIVSGVEAHGMITRGLLSKGRVYTQYFENVLAIQTRAQDTARELEAFHDQLLDLPALVFQSAGDAFELGLLEVHVSTWIRDWGLVNDEILATAQHVETAIRNLPLQRAAFQQILRDPALRATYGLSGATSLDTAKIMFFLVEADDIAATLKQTAGTLASVAGTLAQESAFLQDWRQFLVKR